MSGPYWMARTDSTPDLWDVGIGDVAIARVEGREAALKLCTVLNDGFAAKERLGQMTFTHYEAQDALRKLEWMLDTAEWHRHDGRTHLAIRVADGADLSSKGMCRHALDAAFKAANP